MSVPTDKMVAYRKDQFEDKRRRIVSKGKKKKNDAEVKRIQKLFSFKITSDDISVMMKQKPDANDKVKIKNWRQLFQLKEDGNHYCYCFVNSFKLRCFLSNDCLGGLLSFYSTVT